MLYKKCSINIVLLTTAFSTSSSFYFADFGESFKKVELSFYVK